MTTQVRTSASIALAFGAAMATAALTYRRVLAAWGAERFVVIAAEPLDRQGTPGQIDPRWTRLLSSAVSSRSYRGVLPTPGLVAVEQAGTAHSVDPITLK